MPDTAFAAPHSEDVRTATMHRDDSPIGRAAVFHLRSRFDDLPCCYRSWSQDGKRFFLHGYDRRFEIEFACAETDPGTDLVIDHRCLQEVGAALRHQFGHTTLIAADDPQRDLFELLAAEGAVDLRIMDCTGMEATAAWAFDTVEQIVARATGGRVWVSRIDAQENCNKVVTLTATNC